MTRLKRFICIVMTMVLLASQPVSAGVFDIFKIPGKIKEAKEAVSAAKLMIQQAQQIKQKADEALALIRSNNEITLENARIMAIDKSNTILQNSLQLIKKNMEKRQALEAIADTREKETTVQYSLLIRIKWPEKHGMPKEIELLTKIPQIESEIEILKRQRDYEIRKVVTQVDQAYYDIICNEFIALDLEERLSKDRATLDDISRKFSKGEARKTDVDLMERQVAALEKQYDQAVKKSNTAKTTLSGLINKDVSVGCTFEPVLSEASFDRDALPDIIAYAKENDFDLYEVTEKRKLAEQETDLLLGIYSDRYGSKVRDLENYINNHPDVEYDDFLKKYTATIREIDKPWTGVYSIRIIFFTIKIPKLWFKGKWDGTRYLEDEKFILYTSLVDRDAARKEEEAAIKSLETTINMSFDDIKTMQSSLIDSDEDLRRAEEDYNYQLGQNSKGLVTFDALESSRQAFYSSQQAQFEQLIDYSKSLSAFNQETSGYVDFFLENGSFSASSLESGQSYMGQATWQVNEDLTDYNFTLNVNIPDEYDCNYFRLYYGDQAVGEKTAVDTPLVHSALTYHDNTLMTIRLYNNDTHKYTGTFEGEFSSGTINLTQVAEASPQSGRTVVGQWSLETADGLRSKFTPSITAGYDYQSYYIVYDGQSVAEAEKNQPITTLSLYFGDMSLLSMQLISNRQPIETLYFSGDTEGGGEIYVNTD